MNRLGSLVIVVVSIIIILQSLILVKTTYDLDGLANMQGRVAQATVSFCINKFPTMNITCQTILNQSTRIEDNTYGCQINATSDPGESLNFSYLNIVQGGLIFSVNASGYMSIWANQSGVGIFSSMIFVSDDQYCPLVASEEFTFTMLDINDPPYLKQDIHSFSVDEATTISPFGLDYYFGDVDFDHLTYSSSTSTPLVISINNDTSDVFIYSPEGYCDETTIYFTAYDPYLLFEYSNMVTIISVCEETITPTASGAGGGRTCEPEWKCKRWSDCYVNGTRSRECTDLAACNPDYLKQVFWEECEYIPTCYDGIKNQGEEEIDCGGPNCKACYVEPTCFDGVQNHDEEGVDCGGSCELACVVPPTCFDGIKNGKELGVDCGGSCPACKEIQVPGLIEEPDNSLFQLALLIISILTVLSILYILFRREIKSVLAELGWWFARKRRKQLLLTKDNKEDLITKIKEYENKIALKKTEVAFGSDKEIVQELLNLNRQYFVYALKTNFEFNYAELEEKIQKNIVHESLKKVFELLIKKIVMLESKKIMISKLHLEFMVEELKNLVFGTSKYEEGDYKFIAKDWEISGNSLAKILKLLHNAMVALQFGEVSVAQKRYLAILGVYEALEEKEKNLAYKDIQRLYHYINYEIGWASK